MVLMASLEVVPVGNSATLDAAMRCRNRMPLKYHSTRVAEAAARKIRSRGLFAPVTLRHTSSECNAARAARASMKSNREYHGESSHNPSTTIRALAFDKGLSRILPHMFANGHPCAPPREHALFRLLYSVASEYKHEYIHTY